MRSCPPLIHFEHAAARGDPEVLRLAGLQHGHVLRSQLLEAGIGRSALAHRRKQGWLNLVLPSVYRLVGAPQGRLGRAMAAALFCGGHGLVAGDAAAGIWSMLDTTQQPAVNAPVEVLLVARNARTVPGVRLHRVKQLARQDVRWRSGIPLTSPARTLLDLAGTMDEFGLEAALSMAFRNNLVRRSQLTDVMARNPRAKGVGRLRALLDQTDSLQDTRSGYERKLLKLLEAAELPMPVTNVTVANKTVDGLWPALKLVYELDGWRYHRDKFEQDRLRDQLVLIAGHQLFRISCRQIDFSPYALIARIASIITARRLALQERR